MNTPVTPSPWDAIPASLRFNLWAVVIVGLLVLLPGINTLPLVDRDEPRFAQATLEMQQKDEWIVPTFNGEYRFDKPPLTYWLMRVSYTLCGVNETGARLYTVVSALGVAVLILLMGRQLFDPRSALFGALAWLTCLQVFMHGRLSLADMPMIFCVTLAHWSLYNLLTRDKQRPFNRWFWLLYLSLGFGFLAKGPVAVCVPVLTLILWRFVFKGKDLNWRALQPLPGSVVALLIICAWGVPALLATRGLFWQVGMGEHVIKRGAESFNGRVPVIVYYFITAWVSLYPWSFFAPAIFNSFRKKWVPANGFLVSWFLCPILIFSFYATQLPHYILPGFPAFFLLLGVTAKKISLQKEFPRTLYLVPAIAGLALVSFALSAALNFPAYYPLGRMRELFVAVMMGVAGMTLLPLALHKKAGRLAGLAGLLLIAFSAGWIGSSARTRSPALAIAKISRTLPTDYEAVGYGFQEPSLVFYTDHPWSFVDAAGLQKRLDEPGPACLIVGQRREYRLEEIIRLKAGPVRDHSDDILLRDSMAGRNYVLNHVSGINFARASWVELDIYTLQKSKTD